MPVNVDEITAAELLQLFFDFYTDNLIWSLFLTSTAVHAVVLIASPLQAVFKWYRRRSSDSDTPLPYICAAIGSGLWLRYSIFIEDTKLILLQTYAVIMQIFFLLTLLFYRSKKQQLVKALLYILLLQMALYLYIEKLTVDDGRVMTGRFASAAQIAGSFVCPFMIYRAVKTKVIDFIPSALVIFTCIMELHAIVYSFAIDDFYMLIANTTFCIMDGSLLCMFFIYPTERKNYRKIQEYLL
ncbi:unnamed protein product [Dracunculus medinensis]|uniref:Sugar transporter SWEET n=1 Tax=Dracunculus medinensis TaxID=318479 RepID=A0A0N4U673_DRAME|nr:unnamed protein product [Dracunculus medinensis]